MSRDDAMQAALAAASTAELVRSDVALAEATGGRAPSTLAAYKSALRQVRTWCEARGTDPASLGDRDVAELVASMVRGRCPGFPRAVGLSRVRLVLAAVSHAYESRNLRSPFGPLAEAVLRQVARGAAPARQGYALSSVELRHAINWATAHGPWWLPGVLAVGWSGALRAGELQHCADVVVKRGRVVCITVKGKRGTRVVHLPAAPHAAFCPARWAIALHGHKLPTQRAIHAAMRRVFAALQIPATPHSLRRGWATEAAKRGISLALIAHHLGQADARPVMRYVSQNALDTLPTLL